MGLPTGTWSKKHRYRQFNIQKLPGDWLTENKNKDHDGNGNFALLGHSLFWPLSMKTLGISGIYLA